MIDFTARELAIIAAALDYMAAESTLEERRPVLAHTRRSDTSSAPLRKLADRARSLAVEPITSSPRVAAALELRDQARD